MADGSHDVHEAWYCASELAGLPGLPATHSAVIRKALREGWITRNRKGRGGGSEYPFAALPIVTQAALLLPMAAPAARERAEKLAPRIESIWKRHDNVPQRLRDIGAQRAQALRAVTALVHQGVRLLDARETVAAQSGVSASTLARWADRVALLEKQHHAAALIPDFVGRTRSVEIEAEAWDLFKTDYLRLEQPCATKCYERLQRIARARGWKLPSLRTFERRIVAEVSRGVRIMLREGEEAFDKTFPAQERDRSVFHALEAVNADGHKFDVFVRTKLGDIVRPILVGVQDLYSGKLLGWRLAETESADLARLAFMDVVQRYGIPEKAWLDNGRGFASKMLTGGTPNRYRFKVLPEDPIGVLVGLGIEIHWATPYHGQAKPIERAWRDLCCDRIAKHPRFAGAYTGNKPDAKPENYGSKAVPWDDFVAVMNDEIAAHNAQAKRKTRVCGGIHSFDAMFAASYAQAPIRKATGEQLRTLLLAAEVVTANQYDGSLRLVGNRYWTEALAPYAGKKLMIRFDPDALQTAVAVYTMAGVFVGDAPCTAAIGFADTGAAREHTRAKKQHRRAAKDQAKAQVRMDVARLADQIPPTQPAPMPEATVIAPAFSTPASRAKAEPEALQRTGTDDLHESALGDLLKRMQAKRNAEVGFEPPTD